MLEDPGDLPKIVVLGGYGFFGGLIVRDLLEHTRTRILIAGRHQPEKPLADPRVRFVRADLNDFPTLEAALQGAFALIHCAGPYQASAMNPLHAAIASGVHYLDLAECRDFARRIHECHDAARHANIAVFTGMSVVPGLAALLAQALRMNFDKIYAIRTFVAPGTRGSRGPGTVHSLLAGVGRPMRVPRRGRDVPALGWSEGEWIRFPPPIGWRRQYLALETADFDLFQHFFEVQHVEFKAGSEFAWLNRCLAVVARLRARTGFPRLEDWTNTLRKGLRVLGRFGTDRGGVLVEVAGTKNGTQVQQQIAVVADRNGERIPAVPAALAVAALLRGEVNDRGVVPLHNWLSPTKLFQELSRRRLSIWFKPAADAAWQVCHDPEGCR